MAVNFKVRWFTNNLERILFHISQLHVFYITYVKDYFFKITLIEK